MSFLNNLWYGKTLSSFFCQIPLLPVSWLFGVVAAARRSMYSNGMCKKVGPIVPVVVVGGITAGGTGKTPLCIALVNELKARGYHPGVLSRGYKSNCNTHPCQVPLEGSPRTYGDEPCLIRRETLVPVVIDPKRVRGADYLVALGVDVIVTDDGLQHYPLDRDVEICVLDGSRMLGNEHLLPAGPLREAKWRLKTVDSIVVTGAVAHLGYFPMMLRPSGVCAIDPESQEVLESKATVCAVAGIGNPARFYKSLEDYGFKLGQVVRLGDHEKMPLDKLKKLASQMPVVMTSKDAIKYQKQAKELSNVFVFNVQSSLSKQFFDDVVSKIKQAKYRVNQRQKRREAEGYKVEPVEPIDQELLLSIQETRKTLNHVNKSIERTLINDPVAAASLEPEVHMPSALTVARAHEAARLAQLANAAISGSAAFESDSAFDSGDLFANLGTARVSSHQAAHSDRTHTAGTLSASSSTSGTLSSSNTSSSSGMSGGSGTSTGAGSWAAPGATSSSASASALVSASGAMAQTGLSGINSVANSAANSDVKAAGDFAHPESGHAKSSRGVDYANAWAASDDATVVEYHTPHVKKPGYADYDSGLMGQATLRATSSSEGWDESHHASLRSPKSPVLRSEPSSRVETHSKKKTLSEVQGVTTALGNCWFASGSEDTDGQQEIKSQASFGVSGSKFAYFQRKDDELTSKADEEMPAAFEQGTKAHASLAAKVHHSLDSMGTNSYYDEKQPDTSNKIQASAQARTQTQAQTQAIQANEAVNTADSARNAVLAGEQVQTQTQVQTQAQNQAGFGTGTGFGSGTGVGNETGADLAREEVHDSRLRAGLSAQAVDGTEVESEVESEAKAKEIFASADAVLSNAASEADNAGQDKKLSFAKKTKLTKTRVKSTREDKPIFAGPKPSVSHYDPNALPRVLKRKIAPKDRD